MPLWKRALDLACILIAAPVWLPVMIVLGLLIKIVSPGPALFRQQRIGFQGRRFTIFKFRTMRVNADNLTRLYSDYSDYLEGDGIEPFRVPFQYTDQCAR